MNNINKVLWLPSWFPSIDSPQNGDFIMRQADAVANYLPFYIAYAQATNLVSSSRLTELNINENQKQLIYLYHRKSNSSLIRGLSSFRYIFYYNRIIHYYIQKFGKPDLIHVHVSFRAGLIALWLKWRYRVPYIITEHWTLFTPERKDNYLARSYLFKRIIRKIYQEAEYVLPVSNYLEKNLKELFPFIKSCAIPNVVDPTLFYPESRRETRSEDFTFIHVSGLSQIKNPELIIRTFIKFQRLYSDAKLIVIGGHNIDSASLQHLLKHENNSICFLGILSHDEVAKRMRESDAFVLFSDYETQSCVALEALYSGLPIISSRLPCLEEFINDDNGILVKPGDEDALLKAMVKIYLEHAKYDGEAIASKVQAIYNPEIVGRKIADVYEKILASKRK